MSKPAYTSDISGELIVLGCGTSVGVPALGCGCTVCRSSDPKNHRTRCAIVLGLPDGVLLIDTPPELRIQLIRERIGLVHAVAFTHEHADHIFGLDDLRLFQFYLGHPVPIYCESEVECRIRKAFDYAFSEVPTTHAGATPKLEFHRIGISQFDLLGARVQPLRLKHGPRFDVLGFRIGNVAYCTDTNEIPQESLEILKGVDVLILDALRHAPHVTHFSLNEAIEVSKKIGARQTYFTHLSHDFDFDTTNLTLPVGMQLAHDGLRIPFDLNPRISESDNS